MIFCPDTKKCPALGISLDWFYGEWRFYNILLKNAYRWKWVKLKKNKHSHSAAIPLYHIIKLKFCLSSLFFWTLFFSWRYVFFLCSFHNMTSLILIPLNFRKVFFGFDLHRFCLEWHVVSNDMNQTHYYLLIFNMLEPN